LEDDSPRHILVLFGFFNFHRFVRVSVFLNGTQSEHWSEKELQRGRGVKVPVYFEYYKTHLVLMNDQPSAMNALR